MLDGKILRYFKKIFSKTKMQVYDVTPIMNAYPGVAGQTLQKNFNSLLTTMLDFFCPVTANPWPLNFFIPDLVFIQYYEKFIWLNPFNDILKFLI
jgi:hypothetical protein